MAIWPSIKFWFNLDGFIFRAEMIHSLWVPPNVSTWSCFLKQDYQGSWNILKHTLNSNFRETVYGYQDMCLLPNKDSIENVSIIMASAFGGKIVLTKWTIDLICL
jgi:hypothetical protein